MPRKPLTAGKLIKKLQPIFNKYIRERDKGKPCISCGEFKEHQAGHFYATSTHAGLRFDEDNVHGECQYCNMFNESHLINYSVNLEKRLGTERFLALRRRAEEYKRTGYKFGRVELREMIEEYQEKLISLQ